MSTPESIQIEILSSPDFIKKFGEEAETNPDKIRIIRSGKVEEATELAFGIAEVAAVLTIIQFSFYLTELPAKIHRWIRETNSKRICIQTPVKRIEIIYHKNLTEEEIRNILKASLKI